MTPREIEVLDWLREFMADTGLSPTIRMIAERTGRGLSATFATIESLIRQGALLREPGRKQGLRIADVPDLRPVPTTVLTAELARRGVTLASLDRNTRMAVGQQGRCAANSCCATVKRGHLMCLTHWMMLPPSLRNRILCSNSAGDRKAFEAAVTEARDLIDSSNQRRIA